MSYPEVFSSTYTNYRTGTTLEDYEGTQYAYYNQNNSNEGRKKYVNNNGSASSTNYYYGLRSPASISSRWCVVNSYGSADIIKEGILGIQPLTGEFIAGPEV